METIQKKERITEIDVARGFALFLTVWGHVLEMGGLWFCWIFSFHMPAFFFLSGMTFRPEKYENFGSFVGNRFKKRIVPYLAAVAAGTGICLIRPLYRAALLGADAGEVLAWMFYYAQPREIYMGQVWFLAALFFAEVFAWIWFRLFRGRPALVRGYALLLLAWAGIYIRRIDPYLPWGDRLPWKIDTAVAASVFLILGYYAAKIHLTEWLRKYAWLVGPVCVCLNYSFGVRLFGYTNLCDCAYSPAPYYYTAALAGILALLSGAVICRNSRFWQFCGRNSLLMFIAQTFAIFWVVEGVAAVTGITCNPMFDVPGDKFALAVAAAAFALLVLMALGWNWLCEKAAGKGRGTAA